MTKEKGERRAYTPNEVMELFHISRPTFADWCNKGVFQKISIPGRRRVYVSAESVEKLLTPA